jgi:hypothetical protein
MPINTGSNILKKLTRTSSEYFNRKIYTMLDSVKTMEQEYKLSDPRTMTLDPTYNTNGPPGIIANLQAAHGALLTEHDWPALAAYLPQSNNASVSSPVSTSSSNPSSTSSTSTSTTSATGRARTIRCFLCRGSHHVRDCPTPAGSTGSTDASTGTGTSMPRPLADWKYIRPHDLTSVYTDNRGRAWKFCTHCRCRASGRTGIYQLSHFDSEHVSADPGPPAPAPVPPVPTALPSAPSGNHTQASDTHAVIPPIPPANLTYPDNDDPDGIEFQGMWCVPIPTLSVANATVRSVSRQSTVAPTRLFLFHHLRGIMFRIWMLFQVIRWPMTMSSTTVFPAISLLISSPTFSSLIVMMLLLFFCFRLC